eukprot:comp18967_c0_seq1/m.21257 comp18967_c0_seq1/g.21257  ORF comp18967_c0_seq1/g.21257 comp18967_c0_seq1/m.21257 type:complete len:167 (-) comp18967_c0_seq1:168-668(-)
MFSLQQSNTPVSHSYHKTPSVPRETTQHRTQPTVPLLVGLCQTLQVQPNSNQDASLTAVVCLASRQVSSLTRRVDRLETSADAHRSSGEDLTPATILDALAVLGSQGEWVEVIDIRRKIAASKNIHIDEVPRKKVNSLLYKSLRVANKVEQHPTQSTRWRLVAPGA